MSRGLTADMVAAVGRTELQMILIAEIDTDGGAIRVWTGAGDLAFDGNTYTGVGQFGSVTAIEETLELAARGISLTLSGIPSSLLSSALGDMRQGREVTLWFGIIKNRVLDNYIINGFFDANITGWVDSSGGAGTISWVDGKMRITTGNPASTEFGRAHQQLSGLTTGKEYYLSLDLSTISDRCAVRIGTAIHLSDILAITNFTTGQTQKVSFTPTVTNPWLDVWVPDDDANADVDNIIIIENEPFALVADPEILFKGQTDVVQITEGRETSLITVNAENRLVRLEHKNERRFTKQDQDRFVSGDLGLDYVLQLQDKEIVWGRT